MLEKKVILILISFSTSSFPEKYCYVMLQGKALEERLP
jgi:hypothetical protein